MGEKSSLLLTIDADVCPVETFQLFRLQLTCEAISLALFNHPLVEIFTEDDILAIIQLSLELSWKDAACNDRKVLLILTGSLTNLVYCSITVQP